MTLASVETELAAAVELVEDGHKAFAAGELRSAEALHHAAARSCVILLTEIAQLEERDADVIEPEFTRFEKLLIGIAALLLPYSRDPQLRPARLPTNLLT
jgi:hypothetical protein